MSTELEPITTVQESEQALPRLVYSVKEASIITGLCRTTLWRAMNKGALGYFRQGRRVLFSLDHLRSFMQSSERPSTKRSMRHQKVGRR